MPTSKEMEKVLREDGFIRKPPVMKGFIPFWVDPESKKWWSAEQAYAIALERRERSGRG